MRHVVIAIFCLVCSISSHFAWAGGTNSVFLRMSNMVNELERNQGISSDDAQAWRDRIQDLRDKVDARIRQNGGGMNPTQDRDLYSEIDRAGKNLLNIYQQAKSRAKTWN